MNISYWILVLFMANKNLQPIKKNRHTTPLKTVSNLLFIISNQIQLAQRSERARPQTPHVLSMFYVLIVVCFRFFHGKVKRLMIQTKKSYCRITFWSTTPPYTGQKLSLSIFLQNIFADKICPILMTSNLSKNIFLSLPPFTCWPFLSTLQIALYSGSQ